MIANFQSDLSCYAIEDKIEDKIDYKMDVNHAPDFNFGEYSRAIHFQR